LSLAMPFGKYAGRPLSEIPPSYCAWAVRNLANLHPDLKAALKEEMLNRKESSVYFTVPQFRFFELPTGPTAPEVAWCQILERDGVLSKDPVKAYLMTARTWAIVFWTHRALQTRNLQGYQVDNLEFWEQQVTRLWPHVELWFSPHLINQAIQEVGRATTAPRFVTEGEPAEGEPAEGSQVYSVRWTPGKGYHVPPVRKTKSA